MSEKFVEFEVQGFIKPYDKMRLSFEHFATCGTARGGMSLLIDDRRGRWSGGVIDHKELREIRDAITTHLDALDNLPATEKRKVLAKNPFSRKR
jgi:hypothetical protein